MRLVVFGWGNDARGDDGLGPLLLERVARMGLKDVATIEDFQLQIEHALDLDGADLALFLDAGKDTPAPFAFRNSCKARREFLHPRAVAGSGARRLRPLARPDAAAVLRALRARRKFWAGRKPVGGGAGAAGGGVGVCGAAYRGTVAGRVAPGDAGVAGVRREARRGGATS